MRKQRGACARCYSDHRRVGVSPARFLPSVPSQQPPHLKKEISLFLYRVTRLNDIFHEQQFTNDNFEAMEEAKLIRMATAIREYTISSMLRETASEAAEILNKAAPTARTLLCAPQQLLNDIAEAQKALEQLERSAVSYQKERAADVAAAQKDIMQHWHPRRKEELGSNFTTEPRQ